MPSATPSSSSRNIWQAIFSGRMLAAFLMGFSSGLPLLLTGSLLQAWMTEEGVDLGTIGLFALVGLPYTLKFVWAPLLDRFTLHQGLGRRRSWMLLIQILLALAIAGLGLTQPAQHPLGVALAALLVSFFSASQDIVIDAYRRESLADEELGLGASLAVNGYRIAMLLASGGGLILADLIPFPAVYLVMAAAMAVGLLTTLLAPEPPVAAGSPRTLQEAVVQPFQEYFARQDAGLILLFIMLYKLGDMMASNMTTPFFLDLGFSKTEIGAIVKVFGTGAMVAGGLLGGVLMLRLGIYRSLWVFGILQAVSVSTLAVLAQLGHNLTGLAVVVAFENLSFGMGTSAYLAFMANLTNKKFTATQYALMSSLMGIPRVILAAPTGYLAELLNWEAYFLLCTLVALPGLWLLTRFKPWMVQEEATRAPVPEQSL